jgi:hypothetical protein
MRGAAGPAGAQAGEIIVRPGLERHGEADRARKFGEGVGRVMAGGGGRSGGRIGAGGGGRGGAGRSSARRARFRVRAMPSSESSRSIARRSSARAIRGSGASCTVSGSGGRETMREH